MFFRRKSPKKEAQSRHKELPALVKKHNIRVSAPYGAYPEDVNNVIESLECSMELLSKTNKQLNNELHTVKSERDRVKTELSKLKIHMSLMEIPSTTDEEDELMLNKLNLITPIIDNIDESPSEDKEEDKQDDLGFEIITED